VKTQGWPLVTVKKLPEAGKKERLKVSGMPPGAAVRRSNLSAANPVGFVNACLQQPAQEPPRQKALLGITIGNMRPSATSTTVTALVFLAVFCLSNALGQSEQASSDIVRPAENNGRWGYVNRAGRFVISPKYFAAQPFKEGYALVVTRKPLMPLGAEAGEFRLAQVTWIDSSGREISPPLSVRRASSFSNGLAAVVPDSALRMSGGCAKGGYINTHGRWAIKPQFDGVSDFSEGLAAVNLGAKCGMGGEWGYIDKDGNTVIPFTFLSAGQFHNGRACVWQEQGQGKVIDRDGNALATEKCQ